MTLTNQHEGVKELTVLISSSAITVDGFALGSSVPALGFGTDAAINGVFERVVRGGRSQIFQKTADVMILNLPSRPRRKQGFTRFYLLNYPLNNSIYKKQNKKKQPRNFQVQ